MFSVVSPDTHTSWDYIIDVALVARLHLIANPKLLEEAFDYNLCNTQCVWVQQSEQNLEVAGGKWL